MSSDNIIAPRCYRVSMLGWRKECVLVFEMWRQKGWRRSIETNKQKLTCHLSYVKLADFFIFRAFFFFGKRFFYTCLKCLSLLLYAHIRKLSATQTSA